MTGLPELYCLTTDGFRTQEPHRNRFNGSNTSPHWPMMMKGLTVLELNTV